MFAVSELFSLRVRYLILAMVTLVFVMPLTVRAVTLGPDENTDGLPRQVLLTGMQRVWQQFNRCSAAALTMQISYWRGDTNYYRTIEALNPRQDDASTRLDEMIAYAETFGLKGIERTGGTLDLVKRLVANGFPVLLETVYYDDHEESGDIMRAWMSHNRVVVGYDDDKEEIYVFDSLLGFGAENTGHTIKYSDVEDRWRQLNRAYMVLYEPADEVKLRLVMGDQWDPSRNLDWNYQLIQQDLARANPDAFDYFNLGTALVAYGRFEEATEAYDTAREMRLPMRMLWYQFGIFEAYLAVNRPEDVMSLAWSVLGNATGVEEMYYYVARAYLLQEKPENAIVQLEQALWYNANFTAAADLLAQLRSSTSG